MEFSAGGVIYTYVDGICQFVLILDQYGEWTFPKGHIEQREKPLAAALREVQEEVGISEITQSELIEKIDYWFKFEEELIHKFVYMFLMEAPERSKLVPQLAEIRAAEWFNPEEIVEKLGYRKDSLSLVRKIFEKLSIATPVPVEGDSRKL